MEIQYSSSIDEVCKNLNTSISGLSENEAKHRLLKNGPNSLKIYKISPFLILFRQINNPIIYVLIFAAIISLFLGDTKDFIVILVVILANTLIGFMQEYKAETTTQALTKLTESKTTVRRDGLEISIPSSMLVEGDIVILREGDIIGADMRLINSANLRVNEATITGESVPVSKNHQISVSDEAEIFDWENMVISSTIVVKGWAEAVVIKTGERIYLAKISAKITEKSPPSPITDALTHFSNKYLIVSVFWILLIGLVMHFENHTVSEILFALLAILVSAVPEGLPIALTMALAVGSLRLSKNHVLTRNLSAVETLGSTTLIASDKTGTITQGKLKVESFFTPDIDNLYRCASWALDWQKGKSSDPLDKAVGEWLGKKLLNFRKNGKIIKFHHFDTILKYEAATVKNDGEEITYVKGAAETLILQASNSSSEITKFQNNHDEMAQKGMRVIMLGETTSVGENIKEWRIKIIGCIGFIDPPKSDVLEAVRSTQKAGIRLLMITGDNPLTAKAIATQVGIYHQGQRVLTGGEIDKLTDTQLAKALKNTSVIARVTPDHKYRVVKILQKRDIVAVTGDGVNDILALKIANLGMAMGSGSEAAKASAKMILLNDNLSVIISAVRQGRIIAENMRKVIYYLVVTNFSQLFFILSTIILNLPFPLKPIHILWINLVTDGVLDKTFPFIKAESNLMRRPPLHIKNVIFNKAQLINIIYGALCIGIPNLFLYIHMRSNFSTEETMTTVFTSMVVAQWLNGIQAQKRYEPFFMRIRSSITINPYIWFGVGLGIILQIIVIFYLQDLFSTVSLGQEALMMLFISSVSTFTLLEMKKWVVYYTLMPIKKKLSLV